MDDGNLEAGIALSVFLENHDRVEGLKAADDEQTIEAMALERSSYLADVDRGQCAVSTQLRTSSGRPRVNSQP